jgi:hypothetical protein
LTVLVAKKDAEIERLKQALAHAVAANKHELQAAGREHDGLNPDKLDAIVADCGFDRLKASMIGYYLSPASASALCRHFLPSFNVSCTRWHCRVVQRLLHMQQNLDESARLEEDEVATLNELTALDAVEFVTTFERIISSVLVYVTEQCEVAQERRRALSERKADRQSIMVRKRVQFG